MKDLIGQRKVLIFHAKCNSQLLKDFDEISLNDLYFRTFTPGDLC